MSMLSSSARSRWAFTLVEVVMAIGLVALGVVATFGLLSAAANSSTESDRDTVLVSMTNQVMNDVRSLPFDYLWEEEPRKVTGKANIQDAPRDTTYYFSVEGVQLDATGSTPPDDAIYMCLLKKLPDDASAHLQVPTDLQLSIPTESFKDPNLPNATGRINLLRLQLIFQWPAKAAPQNRQTRTVYESIARY